MAGRHREATSVPAPACKFLNLRDSAPGCARGAEQGGRTRRTKLGRSWAQGAPGGSVLRGNHAEPHCRRSAAGFHPRRFCGLCALGVLPPQELLLRLLGGGGGGRGPAGPEQTPSFPITGRAPQGCSEQFPSERGKPPREEAAAALSELAQHCPLPEATSGAEGLPGPSSPLPSAWFPAPPSSSAPLPLPSRPAPLALSSLTLVPSQPSPFPSAPCPAPSFCVPSLSFSCWGR